MKHIGTVVADSDLHWDTVDCPKYSPEKWWGATINKFVGCGKCIIHLEESKDVINIRLERVSALWSSLEEK